MPSLALVCQDAAHLDTLTEGKRFPLLQRSVSVRCRAGVIITHTPSTLFVCGTHRSRAIGAIEKSIARLAFGSTDNYHAPRPQK